MKHLIFHYLIISGCLSSTSVNSAELKQYKIDAWADNWFAAFIDGKPLLEDSVSIKTERSFNAESLQFYSRAPFLLAFIIKDFKQNDTGLEYWYKKTTNGRWWFHYTNYRY